MSHHDSRHFRSLKWILFEYISSSRPHNHHDSVDTRRLMSRFILPENPEALGKATNALERVQEAILQKQVVAFTFLQDYRFGRRVCWHALRTASMPHCFRTNCLPPWPLPPLQAQPCPPGSQRPHISAALLPNHVNQHTVTGKCNQRIAIVSRCWLIVV